MSRSRGMLHRSNSMGNKSTRQPHQALFCSPKVNVSMLHTLLPSAGESVPAAHTTVSSGSGTAVQQLQAADRAGHGHR